MKARCKGASMLTVLRGGTLIDGTGREPVPDCAIVVEDDRIGAVGPQPEVMWPPSARVIDATGKTILPGFIDAHAHLMAYQYELEKRLTTPASLTVIRTLSNLRATLEAGVTTVREAGGMDLGFKLAVAQGLVPGPRLFLSVYALAQRGWLWDLPMGSGATLDTSGMLGRVAHYCGGVETLREQARDLIHAGADVLNICTSSSGHSSPDRLPAAQFTLEEIQAVVYEAHVTGRRVMAHMDGGPGLRNAVLAGVDSVEHPFYLSNDDASLMVDRGTYLVPTLATNYGIVQTAEEFPAAGIHPQAVEGARRMMLSHAEGFRRAAEAGVSIVLGSDSFGWFQGRNLMELDLMVRCGYSPMQAIVAGTQTAARCLGAEDRIGTLTPGKLADLLVVDGDPLADVNILQDRERLDLIMQGGRIYKCHLDM
jgi:imidazolonepropionase-like amidohydrolase